MIQYKKEVAEFMSEKRLNELGAEGWDNYAINGNAYFFKRIKLSDANPLEEVKAIKKKGGRPSKK